MLRASVFLVHPCHPLSFHHLSTPSLTPVFAFFRTFVSCLLLSFFKSSFTSAFHRPLGLVPFASILLVILGIVLLLTLHSTPWFHSQVFNLKRMFALVIICFPRKGSYLLAPGVLLLDTLILVGTLENSRFRAVRSFSWQWLELTFICRMLLSRVWVCHFHFQFTTSQFGDTLFCRYHCFSSLSLFLTRLKLFIIFDSPLRT
jgi:hypothetical protein